MTIGLVYSGCRVEERLGHGAMGDVFLATRERDGATVVVKLLDRVLAADSHYRDRFEREALALLKLPPHPNVVPVLAVGADQAEPHLILECVPGPTLAQKSLGGPLPLEVALRYARDAALGLASAHAHGLIHRDVKPANILVDGERDLARVLDFGLAKDVFLSGVTQPGQLVGTAPYMSPEQWEEDSEEDGRIDVFGLAVTLYELIAGKLPFDAREPFAIAELILAGDYEPLDEVVDDADPAVARLLDWALEPDPELRLPRMDVFAADLSALLEGRPTQVPALVEVATGRRHYLVRPLRLRCGSSPSCEVVLDDTAPQHAELVREPGAFLVSDLCSPRGTFVEDERLPEGRPRRIQHQARLRCGEVELRLHLPVTRARAAFLDDVERLSLPDPLLRAALPGPPRRLRSWLLELSAPSLPEQAYTRAALAALLGAETAAAAEQRVLARLEPLRQAARERCATWGGETWRAWAQAWVQEWREAGPQLGPSPSVAWVLHASHQGRQLAQRSLAGEGLLLVGRDEKCHLRLPRKDISRRHATLLRLHRGWLLVNEGRQSATVAGRPLSSPLWLEPETPVSLGAVELCLRPSAEPRLQRAGVGLFALDPDWFWALAGLGHPAVATGLVGLLHEPRHLAWLEPAARTLHPEAPEAVETLRRAVGSDLAEKVAGARSVLTVLLGADPGDDLAAWGDLLARRRGELGPQVLPQGWLRATRRSSTTTRLSPPA